MLIIIPKKEEVGLVLLSDRRNICICVSIIVLYQLMNIFDLPYSTLISYTFVFD